MRYLLSLIACLAALAASAQCQNLLDKSEWRQQGAYFPRRLPDRSDRLEDIHSLLRQNRVGASAEILLRMNTLSQVETLLKWGADGLLQPLAEGTRIDFQQSTVVFSFRNGERIGATVIDGRLVVTHALEGDPHFKADFSFTPRVMKDYEPALRPIVGAAAAFMGQPPHLSLVSRLARACDEAVNVGRNVPGLLKYLDEIHTHHLRSYGRYMKEHKTLAKLQRIRDAAFRLGHFAISDGDVRVSFENDDMWIKEQAGEMQYRISLLRLQADLLLMYASDEGTRANPVEIRYSDYGVPPLQSGYLIYPQIYSFITQVENLAKAIRERNVRQLPL